MRKVKSFANIVVTPLPRKKNPLQRKKKSKTLKLKKRIQKES
jgi:hypothetical protein